MDNIPRKQKFILGDRLQNQLSDLLEAIIEVYYAPKSAKYERLNQINIQIEKIRYFFRLGFEYNLYKQGAWEQMAQRLNEIGKMVGGWRKSLKS